MRCGMVGTLVTALALVVPLAGGTAGAETDPNSPKWFEEQIRPILASHCLSCHGPSKQESNLRLDTRSAILAGGDSGPAVVPHKPDESSLIEALKYESFEMPPEGQLQEPVIGRFETWIAHGAVWPENDAPIRPPTREINGADRDWWAFRPLSQPAVPLDPSDQWSQNPIDHFVHRRLAQQQMQPAPRAEEIALVRRLYFDLIGLPPTPEQIDAYFNNDPASRWEELVDALLADPAYGEHWARHWLDVVRYAESDGWNQDAFRPHIWRYRDYVVRSFNLDRSYPEFVRQQLAGDEMPGDDPENHAATGFLRLGIYEYNQRDAKSHWNDIVTELTDVTSDVFFGLGMSCARCHDHKFDPLLQRDYYQLRAFFEPMVWCDDMPYATEQQQLDYAEQLKGWKAVSAEVQTEIDALLKPYHDGKWKSTVDKFPLDIQACFNRSVAERTSWDDQMAYLISRQFLDEGGGPLSKMAKDDKAQYELLKKRLAEFDELKPDPLPSLMTACDFHGTASPTVLPDGTGQTLVPPGFPVVLDEVVSVQPIEPLPAGSTGRRTALANWIVRPDNPLTTRVIVNRIWQQNFGHGLVAAANDFGRLGQPPTHPELLDWLTQDFVAHGWSFKRLHKLIVLSATWQQSVTHPQAEKYQAEDPAERLLWRATVRRLSAEQIRDAMLLATGELDRRVGGPSVDAKTARRSLYVKSYRNRPDELLHAFDMANGLKSVAGRGSTTTPVQALLMMNGSFALGRAAKLAERLQKQEAADCDALLRHAFRLTWGRRPTDDELNQARAFVTDEVEGGTAEFDPKRLIDFCHVLLNSNAFAYVD